VSEIHRCPNPECDPADYTDPDDFGVFETVLPITGSFGWKVECGCGYEGPRADTPEEAERLHNLISAAPDDGKQAGGWIPTQQQFLESVNHIRKELSTYLRLRANKEPVVDSLKSLDRIIFNEEMVLQAIAAGRYAPEDVAPDDGKGQPVALPKVIEEICSTLRAHTAYQRIGDYKLADKLEAAFKNYRPSAWLVHNAPGSEGNDVPYTNWSAVSELIKHGYEVTPLYSHPAPQGWQQGAAREILDAVDAAIGRDEPMISEQEVEAILKRHQEGK
jgi:hypothetical protein